ncbi:MAG TPA: hypothetical protein VFI25_08095 [Planctomycetota bacterium]|nr:hypothetical protein [Planctomycetota bacterium]
MRRLVPLLVSLGSLGTLAPGSDVVVPGAWSAAQGPANNLVPFGVSVYGNNGACRFQQVYAASDFLASGVTFPMTISDLSFRPGSTGIYGSYPLPGQVLNLSVGLSDSAFPPDSLSSSFSANVSGPQAIVFSGNLLLPPVPAQSGNGPYPFAWTIPLATPTVYSGGSDLLLEVAVFSNSSSGPFGATVDAVAVPGDAVSRQYFVGSATAPSAATGTSTLGLVTRFTYGASFVPFGGGCSGWGGYVPTIGSSGGAPTLGNLGFALLLTSVQPGSTAALILGTNASSSATFPLPLELGPFGLPGCFLLVACDGLLGAPVQGSGQGGGIAVVSAPIPAIPALSGGRGYFQWIVFDPLLPGFRLSNAASVVVG